MTKIEFKLNGQNCSPKNHREIQYGFNFSENKDKLDLELSVSELTFVMEDKTRIEQWIATYGYFVGMPFDIRYSDGTTINYILDFTENFQHKGAEISVSIKRYKGWDMFFKNADGLSFFDNRIQWTTADFGTIDYKVIPKNQIELYFSLIGGILTLGLELARSIQSVSDGITDVIKASVPVGVPPAPDWGAIIVASIKLAARIALTIAIAIAFIKFVTQLINLIFPKTRQYKDISYKNLIKKGVEFLGYELKSSLLDGLPGLSILPQPTKGSANFLTELFLPNTLAFTDGYPSHNDTITTLKGAINEFEKISGGETRVIDGVVYIENREFWKKNANQVISHNFTNQIGLRDEYTINTNEQYKRLIVKFMTDPMDINTYDDAIGKIGEASNEVVNTPKKHLELITNYTELRINFAPATRKNELSFIEKAVKNFAQEIDNFTGGGLAAKINNSLGVMQISEQYFNTTKLYYKQGNKLHPNQNKFLGGEAIIKRHESKNIVNNQKKRYSMPIAMTEKEMFSLLDNNFVTLKNGESVEIESVEWSEYEHLATVGYLRELKVINEKSIIL